MLLTEDMACHLAIHSHSCLHEQDMLAMLLILITTNVAQGRWGQQRYTEDSVEQDLRLQPHGCQS
jgi:hypothetical protein